MDLLCTDKLDGFCIVSSDSDFTRLALRIRESGLRVYGFREKKTPKSFLAACDQFIYTENLRKHKIKEVPKKPEVKNNDPLLEILKNVVEDTADDSGWSYLTHIC